LIEERLVAVGHGWNVDAAVARLSRRPFTGEVWRWHSARRDAISARGSTLVSGRYHRARPQALFGPVWRALYLGLTTGACLGEAIRYLGPDGARGTVGRRLSKIRVSLSVVIDVRDPVALGLTLGDLTDDYDWSVPHPPTLTQQVGFSAFDQGIEGLLVPSASLVDSNLVILIDNLLPASALEIADWIDPKLYVPHS
jgi:hypothetical protein